MPIFNQGTYLDKIHSYFFYHILENFRTRPDLFFTTSKENILILFQRHYEECLSHCCFGSSPGTNYYSITIYDIEKKNETKLNNLQEYDKNSFILGDKITYLVKDGYLFIRCGDNFFIYDINQNMKLINKNEDLYDKNENPYGIIESLKNEFKIDFFCNYIDNLILVNDLLEDKYIYLRMKH